VDSSNPNIGININSDAYYPRNAPFHPNQIFPEISMLVSSQIDRSNMVYSGVRTSLVSMGLDRKKQGTSNWNPFSELINLGDKVMIKPNLVLHHNSNSSNIDAVVTHASILRPIIDYVLIALKGTGSVIVGDAPHGDADFDVIVKNNGLLALIQWYNEIGFNIKLMDFRKYIYPEGFSNSIYKKVDRDLEGYTLVNLKETSWLHTLSNLDRLYGSDYDRKQIVKRHSNQNHEYLLSHSVLSSDVIISVPKMKTHKKTGITVNLKNLVGINGDKNYLAHYRIGSPKDGGDEYPDTKNLILLILRKWNHISRDKFLAPNKKWLRNAYHILKIPFSLMRVLYKLLWNKPIVGTGNWYGNDTCWRMCLDLNHILQFSDMNGVLHSTPQRRYFCVVDGIVAGEGNGPLSPDPKSIGIVVSGNDPYQTDYVCAHIMGFKPDKLELLNNIFTNTKNGVSSDNIRVICTNNNHTVPYEKVNFHFQPHNAWIGKIERNPKTPKKSY